MEMFGIDERDLASANFNYTWTSHVEYHSGYPAQPTWKRVYFMWKSMLEYIESICKHTPVLSRRYIEHDPLELVFVSRPRSIVYYAVRQYVSA